MVRELRTVTVEIIVKADSQEDAEEHVIEELEHDFFDLVTIIR